MFRVKICGITDPADALLAAEAGADAIGLNFFAGSPRCVSVEMAHEIAAALPSGVCRVGVFVNASLDEIREATSRVPLDLIQLHGDEPIAFARELRPLPYLRAFRVGESLQGVADHLDECRGVSALPRMVLVDALAQGHYGGSGQKLDWNRLRRDRPLLRGLPLLLAGGLNPANVAEAVAAVRPWGVDVASGVEAAPGQKAPERVRDFVAAAKQALSAKPFYG